MAEYLSSSSSGLSNTPQLGSSIQIANEKIAEANESIRSYLQVVYSGSNESEYVKIQDINTGVIYPFRIIHFTGLTKSPLLAPRNSNNELEWYLDTNGQAIYWIPEISPYLKPDGVHMVMTKYANGQVAGWIVTTEVPEIEYSTPPHDLLSVYKQLWITDL